MAKIILAPNESFEHFHSEESSTILLEGSADYRMGNVHHPLERNVVVLTPAHQSHTITNTGQVECMFGCNH
jgi:mannose-6-phosphate isomerase-like protein (cupin superfamily)